MPKKVEIPANHQLIHELAFEAAKLAFFNGKQKDSIDPAVIVNDLAANYVIAKERLEMKSKQ